MIYRNAIVTRYCQRWSAVAVLIAIVATAQPAVGFDEVELSRIEREYTTYWDRDDFVKAEAAARRGMELAERTAPNNPELLANWAMNLGAVRLMQGDYRECEKLFQRALTWRERVFGADSLEVGAVLSNLGRVYYEQGRYADAEPLIKRALATHEREWGVNHVAVTQPLTYLAMLSDDLERDAEAEALYRRVLAIRLQHYGRLHTDVANAMNNLGTICHRQSRIVEAEGYFKRAIEINQQLGLLNFEFATQLSNLANVYVQQGRHDEALALYRRALTIREKSLGPKHRDVAVTLSSIAFRLNERGKYAEAEPLLLRALDIWKQIPGDDQLGSCYTLINLGNNYLETGRVSEAGPLYQRSLEIREKTLGPEHTDCANSLINLADFYHQTGKQTEALTSIDRAIAIFVRNGVQRNRRYMAHKLRAQIKWAQRDSDGALEDLDQAMEIAEQLRRKASNDERDQAGAFSEYLQAFELAVAWQTELGRPAEAFAAAERCRARTLVEQMQRGGVSILASLPPATAEAFRRRQTQNQETLAALERQLALLRDRKDLSASDQQLQLEALNRKLTEAREASAETYRQIRNASPALKLASGENSKPVPLADVVGFLAKNTGLMLYYSIGAERSFVFAISGDGDTKAAPLLVDESLAKQLDIEAGPLTAERLGKVLTAGEIDIAQQLGQPRLGAKALERLAQLWKLLIPTAEQKTLLAGNYRRFYIVADSILVGLPFETLLVEPGETPKYLLDVGPPIVYAPSAAVLVNLANLPMAKTREKELLLTVADPVYGRAPFNDSDRANNTARSVAGARYGTAGGELQRLPYTLNESHWLVAVFKKLGWSAKALLKDQATEANVRQAIPGRTVVHLACHGITDQKFGNLFGALALTPGKQKINASDDGFLTLPEIYELKLQGTELAILSACQTNHGPQQKGEGVWALSRGFIVAGARRVVASNWLVDDEAGASLMSYFCASLVEMQKQNAADVDYAAALQKAQRWVRGQKKWADPYYWAPFVLLGPN